MQDTKQFDPDLYKENDQIAKEKAIAFLSSRFDYKLLSSEEVYEYDLLMQDHFENQVSIEVERKKTWKSRIFPYDSIDIPFRKNKNTATLFILFNFSYSALALIEMAIIRQSKISIKNTIYTRGEKFFNVNKIEAIFFYEYNGKWYKDFELKKINEPPERTLKMKNFF